jgi:hypothetical protein
VASQENICSLLGGITLPTLYKYYREELDTAMAWANVTMAQALFNNGVKLGFVHHRLRLLVFPMRTNSIPSLAKPEISRFPHKERPHMLGSPTTPGWASACDSSLP